MNKEPTLLQDRLTRAEAEAASIRRQIATAACHEIGAHDWRLIGGVNANCEDSDCACSAPIHECRRCGACDYGDNPEAHEVRKYCAMTRQDQADDGGAGE